MRKSNSAMRLSREGELDPYERLAFAIIGNAADEARKVRPGWPEANSLINFFRSDWCKVLLGTTKLTGEFFIQAFGLEAYDEDVF